jgi:hypothetical protein
LIIDPCPPAGASPGPLFSLHFGAAMV